MSGDRAKTIELNDMLRTSSRGGWLQITRNFYDFDARLRSRALYAMTR